VNAGTLEFMLDTGKRFYFLEMNTRLQVEHPVTELVTGIDLVRHQLQIAAGQPLGLIQEQISPRGHAIEVRLYAEDPENNFIPSTGTVTRFVKPGGPGIRVDSGIEGGDEITQYYDPMIAKLIVYGENRMTAIDRLQAALRQAAVFGVKTNVALLSAIVEHPAFREGSTFTSFLEEYGLDGETSRAKEPEALQEGSLRVALSAAALLDMTRNTGDTALWNGQTPPNPWHTLGPWRMAGESRSVSYSYQGEKHSVAISPAHDIPGARSVQVDTHPAEVISCTFGNDDLVLLRWGTRQIRTFVQRYEGETQVIVDGQTYRFERRRPPNVDAAARSENVAHSQKALTAPMAGTIVKVQAREGDSVEHRQVLVILSAMKMEHTIAAPYAGKVRHVYYQEGDVVKGGAVIVEME
jgi:3-methylcrotonyl-CoA carboxylase alpha subunit